MNLTESIFIALHSLFANKLRSVLTVLGIVIGVAAVIALMSIGRGVQSTITERIQSIGTNLLFVQPGRSSDGRARGDVGSAASLTLEDAEALQDPARAPSVARVAPHVQTFGQVVAGAQNARSAVLGITPDYQDVRNFTLAEGEFIGPQHLAGGSRVAVLGSQIAQDLFGGESALGKDLKINRVQFWVIGVLESKGGTGFGSHDNLVLVPLTTAYNRLARMYTARGTRNVSTISVQVLSEEAIDRAVQEISEILRERHRTAGDDDFVITSQRDALQTLNQVTGVMTAFLGSIAGISLLVGGIGIMNIMLVSVTERTREIGIRKAVGAKRRDILLQFLAEATALSLTGGLLGILLGWGVSRALPGVLRAPDGSPVATVISPDIILLAVAVSVAVGLFFGIYPASRAARLHPIEALRYE